MTPKQLSFLIFLVYTTAYTAAYLGGVSSVPFHPDESTYLYMSGDLEMLWQRPLEMAWQPENQGTPEIRYRTLDAPLGRYLVGIGRRLAGLPPLAVDWDWGLTWEENRQAGALPDAQLLQAGRMGVAVLMPLSLLFLFLTARRLANERVAWISGLLLASNALVLLHTRRAMAEGPVIFTVTLLLWSLVKVEKKPWLGVLPAALAFSAKHSLAALVPVSLLAVLWQPGQSRGSLIKHLLVYGALFMIVTAALNPVLWLYPLQAAQNSLANRQDLVARQAADRPDQEMKSPLVRMVVMAGSLFLVPPTFAEVGNYLDDTRASEEKYLANPLNNLLRSPAAAVVLLVSALFGYLILALRVVRQRPLPRKEVLLLAATLLQVLALLAAIPLPFQRYYLPLVPHACLWAAFGLDQLLALLLSPRGRLSSFLRRA